MPENDNCGRNGNQPFPFIEIWEGRSHERFVEGMSRGRQYVDEEVRRNKVLSLCERFGAEARIIRGGFVSVTLDCCGVKVLPLGSAEDLLDFLLY